jgi:hypothetical protein
MMSGLRSALVYIKQTVLRQMDFYVKTENAFWCALYSVVVWLILPVEICLSGRLSHACISLNVKRKTANGSSIGYRLLGHATILRISPVTLELIRTKKGAIPALFRSKPSPSGNRGVINIKRIDRKVDVPIAFPPYHLCWCCIGVPRIQRVRGIRV